ncbi:MAG: cytochrome c [Magnetococcales bacterium]|nr:cytochrome c [Magnetococcales bacterium]
MSGRLRTAVLLVAGWVGVASAAEPAPPVGPVSGPGIPLSDHERGRALYNFRCYFCHGYSGDARTLAASYLHPKPRDFTALAPEERDEREMIRSVSQGREKTAMVGFSELLSAEEIRLVVGFVREEFMRRKAKNTRYHTPANGWENHERYAAAYPFATGALPLDAPDARLTPEQQRGKALYMESCVTCHDRGRVEEEGPVWEPRPVSFPRGAYSHQQPPPPLRWTDAPAPPPTPVTTSPPRWRG